MMPLLLPWILMTAGAEPLPTTGIVLEAESMTLEEAVFHASTYTTTTEPTPAKLASPFGGQRSPRET